jgi:WD40 repeat protein
MRHQWIWICFVLPLLCACSARQAKETSDKLPDIFPDYINVTVPCNIAPLNFEVKGAQYIRADFYAASSLLGIATGKTHIEIDESDWQKWTSAHKGQTLKVIVSVWNENHPDGVKYKAFDIAISKDNIDPWIAYRLIEPGYEVWNQMGIYQRCLSTFEEDAIITNRQNHTGCVNCHSFKQYSPSMFMFHARGKGGGTMISINGKVEKLDMSKLNLKMKGVYPMWHPSGRYIVFSSNKTFQSFFHAGQTPVEVYDTASDLFIYDVAKHREIADSRFTEKNYWETFPAFSPDGKYLYFCRAKAVNMPMDYQKLKYDICRISFDANTGRLGEKLEVIYDAEKAGGSASFPRLSPDGKYLLFTLAANATFPIWHKEADLKMIRLADGKMIDTSVINSKDVESYHSWSSNGKWIIFSSRRLDGRYTRLFIAHIDENGMQTKPFLLPQKDPEWNVLRMKSYNILEFVKGKVKLNEQQAADMLK